MKLKNALLLILTATIWGSAFVAQSIGMDYIEPFTFGGARMLMGALALIPVMLISEKKENRNTTDKSTEFKNAIKGGIICGLFLFLGSSFQQIGIVYTTPGKAGFITALYIILVPVIGIFLKKKCSPMIWLSVLLAVSGFYLLCINEDFILQKGDLFELACAVLFAFHILVIDHYSPLVNGVRLSCIQFFTGGILSFICAFIFETPTLSGIASAYIPLLYTGILSCGVGYTLQIIAQKGMNPTLASLLMSLESVISVIASAIILKQYMTMRELYGCIIIFVAIILAQIPWNKIIRKQIIT